MRTSSRERCLRAGAIAVVCLVPAACGGSGGVPDIYVLGGTPGLGNVTVPQNGLPVMEVKPVQLPGYLDTTDLVVRRAGGQVVPSRTGRWGERLSEGFNRALTTDLATLLPRMAVTATSPVERPARQVLVDVETFEATETGGVVLVARWTLADGAGRRVISVERMARSIPLRGNGDADVAAGLTGAVQALATRIAASAASAGTTEKTFVER